MSLSQTLLHLTVLVMTLLGFFTLFVGVFVAVPLSFMLRSVAFRDIFGLVYSPV